MNRIIDRYNAVQNKRRIESIIFSHGRGDWIVYFNADSHFPTIYDFINNPKYEWRLTFYKNEAWISEFMSWISDKKYLVFMDKLLVFHGTKDEWKQTMLKADGFINQFLAEIIEAENGKS